MSSASNFQDQIITGLVVNIILAIVTFLYKKMRIYVEKAHPLLRPIVLALFAVTFVVLNVTFEYYYSNISAIIFLVLSFSIFVWLAFTEVRSFWRLGILGGDRTIEKGVNYRKALSLCKDSMEFLGIGAGKLIAERDDFLSAIRRCNRNDRPIRFLLCPPDHPRLLEIARQASKPEEEYQETVKKSLRVLRNLRYNESRNIQVKFYSQLPLFRLMFINDSICLASHYILGEGSGSQLPQLHILRKPFFRRDIESFYHPLKEYYEELWKDAQAWDFNAFL
jgi:hypothetical protein